MDNKKYIKRKYPVSWEKILETFDDKHIQDYIKDRNYHVGMLEEDINDWEAIYPKGTLCLYQHIKSYFEGDDDYCSFYGTWDGTFDQVFVFNCKSSLKEVITPSGYNSIKTGNRKVKKLEERL